MARRFNPRKVKIHQSYTVEEAALVLGRSVPTVRSWIKKGLPVLRAQIPFLILGADLREYLEAARKTGKTPLQSDELYCLKCRKPRKPYGALADYISTNASKGRLEGLCPVCGSLCNRFTSQSQLPQFADIFEITIRPHRNA